MKKPTTVCLFGTICLLMVTSCSGPAEKTPVEQLKESIATIQPGVLKISDVARIMEISDAEYLPGITVPTDIIEKYMSGDTLHFLQNEIGAAGLMGMYMADVVYHGAFMNDDAAFESYSAGQLIANELGFGDVFVENIISRYESDTFRPEGMLDEIDRAMLKFDETYSSSDRARVLVGFIAGNYIEKLYQIHATLQNFKSKDVDDEYRLILAKEFVLAALSQHKPIDKLIEMIEQNQYRDDPGLFLMQLKQIRDTYTRLEPLDDNIETLTAEKVFQNEDFNLLFDQITEIRQLVLQQLNE